MPRDTAARRSITRRRTTRRWGIPTTRPASGIGAGGRACSSESGSETRTSTLHITTLRTGRSSRPTTTRIARTTTRTRITRTRTRTTTRIGRSVRTTPTGTAIRSGTAAPGATTRADITSGATTRRRGVIGATTGSTRTRTPGAGGRPRPISRRAIASPPATADAGSTAATLAGPAAAGRAGRVHGVGATSQRRTLHRYAPRTAALRLSSRTRPGPKGVRRATAEAIARLGIAARSRRACQFELERALTGRRSPRGPSREPARKAAACHVSSRKAALTIAGEATKAGSSRAGGRLTRAARRIEAPAA